MFFLLNSAFAHVELTYPEGGETFHENDTLVITWVEAQPHNTQNWELYYSQDAGETWHIISQNIAVPLREFEWVVPEGETTTGRIKVIQNNEVTDYQDVSSNFTVEKATGIFDEQIFGTTLKSFINYPNPFTNSTTFSFYLDTKTRLKVDIYSINGLFISTPIDSDFDPGEHEVKWSGIKLNAGIYFCTIQFGSATRTKKLIIR